MSESHDARSDTTRIAPHVRPDCQSCEGSMVEDAYGWFCPDCDEAGALDLIQSNFIEADDCAFKARSRKETDNGH